MTEDGSGSKREFLFDAAQLLPGDNGSANDLFHDDNGTESNNRRNRTDATTAEGPRTMLSVQEQSSMDFRTHRQVIPPAVAFLSVRKLVHHGRRKVRMRRMQAQFVNSIRK